MPPGGFLVNVARGGVVDRDSIVSSIKSGHTAGFATDVFWKGTAGLSHTPEKSLSGAKTQHF
jgi:phosphoglycerate dehydrogenase-like enzyme